MLRNIPANLSPELVRILMEMGHGDEILLADANFPGHHLHPRTVRADGLMIPDLLRSILTLMPLDRYSDYQVALMETVGDDPRPPVWDVYEQIWTEAEAAAGPVTARTIERMAVYEHTPSVYAVVPRCTGTSSSRRGSCDRCGALCPRHGPAPPRHLFNAPSAFVIRPPAMEQSS